PHSMRKLALASIAAATLCLRLPVHAQDLVLDRFGDYLDSLRAQVGIPGLTAAIVGANDITWERPFGYSNVERLVATRTDTLYHVDGLTQTLTATLVLRCVEQGRLSLDGRAGDATIRQLLTHTTGAADAPQFLYRPDRLAPLAEAVSTCTGESFRTSMAGLLDQLNMIDAVPGPDASPQAYASKLDRLATPYAVNAQRRPSPSRYAATTLTAAAGLIATTRDLATSDVELKRGRRRARLAVRKVVRGTLHAMTERRGLRAVLALAVLALGRPAGAADWQIRPFVGFTFGGRTTLVNLDDAVEKHHGMIGVTNAILGDVVGIDIDLARGPGFFQSGDRHLVLESSVTTLMGNFVQIG